MEPNISGIVSKRVEGIPVSPNSFFPRTWFSERPSLVKSICRIGFGFAIAHHGEILQGIFSDVAGESNRGLVTLPLCQFGSRAVFKPRSFLTKVLVFPKGKEKARRAAELTLRFIEKDSWGGTLYILSDLPSKFGFGVSTSDVVSTIRSVADAFGVLLSSEIIGRLSVEAEIASDSLMYDLTVLFAQREGRVLEYFGIGLPRMEVLGFCDGPPIDTLAYPPAIYDWRDVEAFKSILGLFRRALATRNAALLGHVATASAVINQKFMPKPNFDHFLRLVDQIGALGIQVSHSGCLVGLLFPHETQRLSERINVARISLQKLGIERTWQFSAGGNA